MGARQIMWAMVVAAVLGESAGMSAQGFAAGVTYDFTGATAATGTVAVTPASAYTQEKGYGFDFTAAYKAVGEGSAMDATSITADKPFFFSADVPSEGNYRVTVWLGEKGGGATSTTVKAELRRLMLEKVETKPGEVVQKRFVVNVRVPEYAGGAVKLKGEREKVQEAWAWDKRITLEFNGKHPAVAAVEIEKVEVPTVYILGDSTSCDQGREPWGSWGQMFTRFFKDDIGVANHGESGESVKSANGAKRFDKILSLLKPGDFFITQYGHNDMKGVKAEEYQAGLEAWVKAVKGKGATAIVVTPVARHRFNKEGNPEQTLGDFPAAARKAAEVSGAILIDLNEMSTAMYAAMGDEKSLELFVKTGEGKWDQTHHNSYGAYEIAKCMVQGVKEKVPELAKHITDDFTGFDPTKPDAAAEFPVPATPLSSQEKPFGN